MGQQPTTLELTRDNGDSNFDSAANQARDAWQVDLNSTVLARASGLEEPLQPAQGRGQYSPEGISPPADSAQGQAQPGDLQAQRKQLLPEEPTPAQQQSRAALEAYAAAPDKPKAIWELRPQFEESITTADTAFSTTVAAVKTELQQLKPEMDAVKAIMKPFNDAVGAEIAKVRPEELMAVGAFLQQYSALKPEDPRRAQMAEAMESRYPGLIPAVDKMTKALEDNAPQIKPLNEKLEGLSTRLSTALSDRVNTRIAYSLALRDGGDEPKAAEVYEDAQRIAAGAEPVTPEERRERDKKRLGIREA